MTITKIETGSTTEGDQTNINITETNTKPKSSLNSQTKCNGNDADSKRIH